MMTASTDFRHSLLAGIVSGVLTRTCIEPLDVLKIRFQLQVEPINQARLVRQIMPDATLCVCACVCVRVCTTLSF